MFSLGGCGYTWLIYEKADIFDRKGDLVTTPQGKKLQQRTWTEMLEVLSPYMPQETKISLQAGSR